MKLAILIIILVTATILTFSRWLVLVGVAGLIATAIFKWRIPPAVWILMIAFGLFCMGVLVTISMREGLKK